MTVHDGVAAAPSRDFSAAREDGASLATVNTCFGAAAERGAQAVVGAAEGTRTCELSVRALNVLKVLAAEMSGESPARNDWTPSDAFLRALTFEQLAYARNCGPLTMREIIRWAGSRGIGIAPRGSFGRSLPKIWSYLEARFAAGELTADELAEALERSVQRKNTRIPVAVQRILLTLLGRSGESPPGA